MEKKSKKVNKNRTAPPVKNAKVLNELNKTLNSKPKFGRLVKYSLQCYQRLAVDESSIEEMIECNVIETLQTLLKKNPGNQEIMQQFNEVICHFSKSPRIAALIAERLDGDFLHLLSGFEQNNVDDLNHASAVAALVLLYSTHDHISLYIYIYIYIKHVFLLSLLWVYEAMFTI